MNAPLILIYQCPPTPPPQTPNIKYTQTSATYKSSEDGNITTALEISPVVCFVSISQFAAVLADHLRLASRGVLSVCRRSLLTDTVSGGDEHSGRKRRFRSMEMIT